MYRTVPSCSDVSVECRAYRQIIVRALIFNIFNLYIQQYLNIAVSGTEFVFKIPEIETRLLEYGFKSADIDSPSLILIFLCSNNATKNTHIYQFDDLLFFQSIWLQREAFPRTHDVQG